MGARDEYVSAMKSAFVSLSTRVMLAWLVSLVPATWNPFVLKLLNLFVEPILKIIFTKIAFSLETGAFFYYIDTRVGAQSKGFENAAFANRLAQINGTPEEKKKAEDILWNNFEPFARLTS